jgi:hypothetical protein
MNIQNGIFLGDETSLQDALKLINNVNIEREYDDFIDPNQYVGWGSISSWNPLVRQVFSKKTVKLIQQKTSQYLDGVDSKGRKIIPSHKVVYTALLGIFQNYKPNVGDIYGKYLVVDESQRDDYSAIVDQTISLLVRGIRTDLEMTEQNNNLTIWKTVLGDFSDIRSHPVIKIREKRPDPFLFQMHY